MLNKLNKKTLSIILFLVVFFLGLFILSLSRKTPTPPKEKLSLLSVEPSFDPNYLYDPISMQVALIFNQPLDLQGFSYSLTPPVKITPVFFQEGRKIILGPEGLWPEGEFTLVISEKTTSRTGNKLGQDYFYRFKVGVEPGGAD